MPLELNHKIGLSEFKFVDFWQSLIGEFIGNFILNFFAVGACTQFEQNGVFKALAFGFAIFVAITVSILLLCICMNLKVFQIVDCRAYKRRPC